MQHVNEQLNILSLFIQKNQDFYEKKFKKMEETGKSISWNWAAFFMGIYWMIYRKMYFKAGAFFILSLVASSTPYIGWILNIADLVGIAVYGNALYLDHVSGNLKKAKIFFPDTQDLFAEEKGGTNLSFAIVAYIIQVIVTVVFGGIVGM